MLLFAMHCIIGMPMDDKEAAELIDQLVAIGQLPTGAVEPSEVSAYKSLNLIDWPECPQQNDVYACDSKGRITSLHLTASVANGTIGTLQVNYRAMRRFQVDNFTGLVIGVQLDAADAIVVRDSRFVDRVMPIGLPFIFSTPGNLTLVNVSFPRYLATAVDHFQVTPAHCVFVNVSFPCPTPSFLWPCYKAGNSSFGAIGDVPCLPAWNDSVPIVLPFHRFHLCESFLCRPQCDPPPANLIWPPCNVRDNSAQRAAFFPASPGFSTLEFATSRFGEIVWLEITSNSVIGLVRRIEVFNYKNDTWAVLFRDDVPTRRIGFDSGQVVYYFPLGVMTNRIRLHLEQWFQHTDTITGFRMEQAQWPLPAKLAPRLPACNLNSLVVLNKRSMLDETIADSLCIGRICQLACANADSFTFERAVAPPLFLVVDGGNVWRGGTLVANITDETRVYSVPGVVAPTAFVNASGFDQTGVRRVRLVGSPIAGQALPGVTEPSRRGLAGIFVKFRRQVAPPGATVVPDGTSAFAGKSSAPFAADADVSVAVVDSQTFAFANGTLWRFAGDQWSDARASLTRAVENRGVVVARRKLVAIGNSMLGVVSADSRIHDGSTDQLLVNRRVVLAAIDVLDVGTGVWFENFVRHDIALNISDVDVVRWNATHFGVVERATARASVIEWRPLPYALVQCTSNSDCQQCLTNEANDEACRWCGTRCTSRLALCTATELPVVNASNCATETTATSIGTATAINATASSSDNATTIDMLAPTTATTSGGAASTSAIVPQPTSDALLPLYVVIGVVGGLAVIGGALFLAWRIRNGASAEASRSPEKRDLELKEKVAQPGGPGTIYDTMADPEEGGEEQEARYGSHL
jgi:hypothetical protein